MNQSLEDSISIAMRGNNLPYFDFNIFRNPCEKGCAISSRACDDDTRKSFQNKACEP